MLVVVALGGNAILRRGQPMSVANQRDSIARACEPLAHIAREHDLVVSHGNGPQVGLLALQAASFDDVSAYPFDVLGAQTEGMLGYMIEQELGNQIGNDRVIATLVTRTLIDPRDPAFENPSKFVGPVYDAQAAHELSKSRGWVMKSDGPHHRRVVPSPRPLRILEIRPIEWMLAHHGVVICAGGGGVPTKFDSRADLMTGVEAVIDKDLASSVLARDLGADMLIIATDVDGVFVDYGEPQQRQIARAHPDALDDLVFPAGSMGPKVLAAQQFARAQLGDAVIGSLSNLDGLFAGTSGTVVSLDASGIEFRTPETHVAIPAASDAVSSQ